MIKLVRNELAKKEKEEGGALSAEDEVAVLYSMLKRGKEAGAALWGGGVV